MKLELTRDADTVHIEWGEGASRAIAHIRFSDVQSPASVIITNQRGQKQPAMNPEIVGHLVSMACSYRALGDQ